jgi:hypothetical protein
MGCQRQRSFNAHDPLGLIAAPIAPAWCGETCSVGDHRKLAIDTARPTRVQAVVKAISGALIITVVLVNLVAPPPPAMNSGAPSWSGTSKSFAEWCPHFSAGHVSSSRASIFKFFERAWIARQ